MDYISSSRLKASGKTHETFAKGACIFMDYLKIDKNKVGKEIKKNLSFREWFRGGFFTKFETRGKEYY